MSTLPRLSFGSAHTPSVSRRAITPVTPAARRRAIRVYVLTLAIVLMSLADLIMTLTFLRAVGMGEANPIARYVIGFNSPVLLSAWKCATVGLACLIFIIIRHRRSTEIACWACAGVLLALTLGWIQYANEAHKLTSTLQTVSQVDSSLWVSMTGHEEGDAEQGKR